MTVCEQVLSCIDKKTPGKCPDMVLVLTIWAFHRCLTFMYFTGGGIQLLVSNEAEETAHEGTTTSSHQSHCFTSYATPSSPGENTLCYSLTFPLLCLRFLTASSPISTLCVNRSAPFWPGASWGPRAPCMTSAASSRSASAPENDEIPALYLSVPLSKQELYFCCSLF